MITIMIKENSIVASGHANTNEVCARVSTVLNMLVNILNKKIKENEFLIGKTIVKFNELNKQENELYHKFIIFLYELKNLYPNMIQINCDINLNVDNEVI